MSTKRFDQYEQKCADLLKWFDLKKLSETNFQA